MRECSLKKFLFILWLAAFVSEYALGIGAGVRLFQSGYGFGVRDFYSGNNCERRRCGYYAGGFSDCRFVEAKLALVEISRSFGFSDLCNRRRVFSDIDRNDCVESRHLVLRRLYADHSIAENRFTAVCAVDRFTSGGFICRSPMVQAINNGRIKNVIKSIL